VAGSRTAVLRLAADTILNEADAAGFQAALHGGDGRCNRLAATLFEANHGADADFCFVG
jgi:hypothetical protein